LLYWDGKGQQGLRSWKRDDDDDDDSDDDDDDDDDSDDDDDIDNDNEDNYYLNCQQEMSGLVMFRTAFEGIST